MTNSNINERILVQNHTPHNKKRNEAVGGVCEVAVTDYDGTGPRADAWLEIQLSEMYTPEGSSRRINRTVCVHLNSSQRAKLLAALSRDEASRNDTV